jgi:pyruvate/2-oxoacid:ferredoxin oxidoreductase beta subunit
MKFQLPDQEWIYSGHPACPGCGAVQALRFALKALGPKVMLVMPACCAVVITGPYPTSCVKVPVFHTAFATTAAVASGLKHGLEVKGDYETTVVGWAGDGGTYDIGFQALSGAVDRNEDFIYVFGHPLEGLDRNHPVRQGYAQKGHDGDNGRPPHPVRGQRLGRFP